MNTTLATTTLFALHFERGLKAHTEAYGHAKAMKLKVLEAGRAWRLAQAMAEHGEIETLCDAWQVSRRTFYHYVETINWAEAEVLKLNPSLKGEALDRAVDNAVLTSPKPITALLRDWQLIEQVGAYDPQAYAQKKLAAPAQMEFHFEPFVAELTALRQSPTVHTLAPSSLQKLRDELQASLEHVNQLLNHEYAPA